MLTLRTRPLGSLSRTFSATALLLATLAAPEDASGNDGEDMMRGMLGEIERRAQRRPSNNDLIRRLEPVWTACAAGDIPACHSAAAFPLNANGRALLQEHLLRAEIARQAFEQNQVECAIGRVAACDAALAYPFATDRATLVGWRELAIEQVRREQERRDAEQHASEERMRALAARQLIPAATSPAAPDQAAPRRTTAAPAAVPREAAIVAFAILWLVWFVFFRKPGPLDPVSALTALYARLVRRSTPSQHPKAAVMIDDRESLLSPAQRTAGGAPFATDFARIPVMGPGQDTLRVKIKRDQVTGLAGKVTFCVNFIAELSPQARDAVRRYRFGKTILYQKDVKFDGSVNVFHLLWRALWLRLTRKRWQITISDLVDGRTIQCKDILEVLDVEECITAATKTFASVLRAASWFGGEEIVEF